MIYARRAQAAEVVACADRAEQHWEQAAEAGARERATALELRGRGYLLQKNYPAVLAAYREALGIDRAIKAESDDVVVDLINVAEAERAAGERDAAERDYRDALRIAKKLDDRVLVATVTGNLALLVADREDWEETERLAREALELVGNSRPIEVLAQQYALLAQALARQEKKAEALPFARRAVELYTKVGSRNLEWAKRILHECGG